MTRCVFFSLLGSVPTGTTVIFGVTPILDLNRSLIKSRIGVTPKITIYTSLGLNCNQHDILIGRLIMGYIYGVLTWNSIHECKQLLNLTWEHIYAVYLEHIVTASLYRVKSGIMTSALARLGDNA